MVWLKADAGLGNTYKKLVYASKADVEWNGFILAENNTVILPGSVNSLIFDFDLKKVYPNIIDIPDMPADISEIDGKQLLKNIFNMTLYIFGKWGALQGIRVEHTYEKIDLLLKQILKEAGAEAYYSRNGIKFSCDGKSVVFEDIILAAVNKIKEDERTEEEGLEDGVEEEYPQGLWHDMKWKTTNVSFARQDLDEEEYLVLAIRENFFSKEIVVTLNRRLQDIYNLKRAKETIDLESYRICKSAETFNFLCSMINQNPFLAQKLCQVPKEEAVMILQKAASLSDKQISDNKNMLNHIITIVSSK